MLIRSSVLNFIVIIQMQLMGGGGKGSSNDASANNCHNIIVASNTVPLSCPHEKFKLLFLAIKILIVWKKTDKIKCIAHDMNDTNCLINHSIPFYNDWSNNITQATFSYNEITIDVFVLSVMQVDNAIVFQRTKCTN